MCQQVPDATLETGGGVGCGEAREGALGDTGNHAY